MIDPEIHDIITGAVDELGTTDDPHTVAHVVISSLAMSGYAIVKADPEVARRIVAETQKKP